MIDCPSCGYPLTVGSLIDRPAPTYAPARFKGQTVRFERYNCRRCHAETGITIRLRKPSPLSADELQRLTNRPGSHTPG